MESLVISNFSDICRFCIGSDDLQEIFPDEGLLDKILAITDLNIEEDDPLPKKVCLQCKILIKEGYDFRIKCQKIDEELRKSLQDDLVIETDEIQFGVDSNEILINDDSEIVADIIEQTSNFSEEDHESIEEMTVDYLEENLDGSEKSFEFVDKDSESSTDDKTNDNNTNDEENIENSATTVPKQIKNQQLERNRLVPCQICFLPFSNLYLKAHLRMHTETDIPCVLCNAPQVNSNAMRTHLEVQHNLNPETMEPLKPKRCKQCKFVFYSHKEYMDHRRTHKEEFECKLCSLKFLGKYRFMAHKSQHIGQNEDGVYPCETCGKGFAQRSSLHRHIRVVHLKTKNYVCSICSKRFSQATALKSHLESHEVGEFICDVCGYCSSKRSKLTSHKRNKHPNNEFEVENEENPNENLSYGPVECEVCGVSYSSQSRLNIHKRRVHSKVGDDVENSNSETVQCDICARFVQAKSLKNHLSIHSDLRPYKCSICDLTFSTKAYCRQHEGFHKNIRPYSCKSCDMKFKTLGHLQAHSRTHTGYQPFQCHICQKRFAFKTNLKVHQRLHTGERPFICDICGDGFVATNALKRHKKTKHNQ